jgi:hypothetical protein
MDVNHQDIVARVHAEHPPEHTIEGTLEFLVRVLAELPRDERAGMLRKDAGENIAPFHGVMVSVGRICYPDGQLYKIATDIPTTLAPVWNDDGPVEPSRYFDVSPFLEGPAQPATPSADPPPAEGPTDPGDETIDDEFDRLFALLENGIAILIDLRDQVRAVDEQLAAVRREGVRVHLGA